MLDQSIDKEFLAYFVLLSEPQKESLLSLVKSFVSKEGRITVKAYNEELEAAENRIAEGKYTEHTDLEKESEQW
ncbi:hypothetical protein KKB44_06760 [Candidatus Micrarchaeota archaeon]|nr:hypothetical protein [Candidatus Micrarchaeota archaeon]